MTGSAICPNRCHSSGLLRYDDSPCDLVRCAVLRLGQAAVPWAIIDVVQGPPDILTDTQRAWTLHSESLWARARAIAEEHPGIDAGDVYHALRCLELTPTARLRQAFSRGRLRADAR